MNKLIQPAVASRRRFLQRGGILAAAAGIGVTGASAPALAAGGYDSRLAELGISLPEVPPPVANYVPYRVANNLVFVAGQLAFKDGELMHPGKIPTDVSLEQGQEAARQCVVNLIAALKAACDGNLDRVQACMRLEGFIASADEFTDQSKVMNGASDFIVEVFGDVGRHSRIAVGVNTLPLNASVEVAGVFAIG